MQIQIMLISYFVSKFFMVEKKDAKTLLPIIQNQG